MITFLNHFPNLEFILNSFAERPPFTRYRQLPVCGDFRVFNHLGCLLPCLFWLPYQNLSLSIRDNDNGGDDLWKSSVDYHCKFLIASSLPFQTSCLSNPFLWVNILFPYAVDFLSVADFLVVFIINPLTIMLGGDLWKLFLNFQCKLLIASPCPFKLPVWVVPHPVAGGVSLRL